MIAILKKNHRYLAAIVCDHCGKAIDDAMAALVVSSSAPEGTMAQAFHVHKGERDRALCDKLGGIHGSEELVVHLLDLIRNTLGKSDMQSIRNLLKSSGD